jgi:hypothetical protein
VVGFVELKVLSSFSEECIALGDIYTAEEQPRTRVRHGWWIKRRFSSGVANALQALELTATQPCCIIQTERTKVLVYVQPLV